MNDNFAFVNLKAHIDIYEMVELAANNLPKAKHHLRFRAGTRNGFEGA